jgi:hypothetical protein
MSIRNDKANLRNFLDKCIEGNIPYEQVEAWSVANLDNIQQRMTYIRKDKERNLRKVLCVQCRLKNGLCVLKLPVFRAGRRKVEEWDVTA